MSHDLPYFGFAHAVHSDVLTTTLVIFNNCRLTYGSLIQFENKQFERIARCLKLMGTHENFRQSRLFILPVAAFLR